MLQLTAACTTLSYLLAEYFPPTALTYFMFHCMPACMVDIDGASGNAGDFNIRIAVHG